MVKSRILAVVVLVGAVLFAVLYNDNSSMTALSALLLLYLIALLSVLLSPWLLPVEEWVERRFVFRDESLIYRIGLRNRGILPYGQVRFNFHDVETVSYIGEGLDAFSMNPGSRADRELTLNFPYRGVYKVGVKSITVADFLGIFRITFRVRQEDAVVVYPTRDPAFEPPLKAELLYASASNLDLLQDSYADVTDVRKYIPSDDYKKIHWKLTAKRGEFIVKNYQASVLNKSIVMLDAQETALRGAEKAALEDAVTSGVASALFYCVQHSLPVELRCGQEPNDSLEGNLDSLYLLLAELEFDRLSGLEEWLGAMATSDGGYYNILLFTSHLSEEYARQIRAAHRTGHHVLLYFYRARSIPLSDLTRQQLEDLREDGIYCEEIETGIGENRE